MSTGSQPELSPQTFQEHHEAGHWFLRFGPQRYRRDLLSIIDQCLELERALGYQLRFNPDQYRHGRISLSWALLMAGSSASSACSLPLHPC